MLIREIDSGTPLAAITVLFVNAGIRRSVKMSAGKILRAHKRKRDRSKLRHRASEKTQNRHRATITTVEYANEPG